MDSIGAENESGLVAGAGGDATGGDEWQCGGLAHEWNEAEGGGFFATVVTTGFKAFGDDGVNAGFQTFACKN